MNQKLKLTNNNQSDIKESDSKKTPANMVNNKASDLFHEKGKHPEVNAKPFRKSKTFGRKDNNFKRYKGNDMEWYKRDPILLDTAKQVTFNIPFGTTLRSLRTAVPGIIRLDYVPTVGYTDSSRGKTTKYAREADFYEDWILSPFNMAMRETFGKVRSSRGGSRPYEFPDMGEMLLSAMSIFSYAVHLGRVLACYNHFNFNNRYLGSALIGAQGHVAADIAANYMDYITRLNLIITRAGTIQVPKNIAVLDEWNWRCSTIFKDSPIENNVKNQFIVNVPMGIYEYDEANGDAVFTYLPSHQGHDFGWYLDALDRAISKLWNSETFAIMMGDIASVFQNDVVTLGKFDVNAMPKIEYSVEFGIQVTNMDVLNRVYYDSSNGEMDRLMRLEDFDTVLPLAFSVHQDRRDPSVNNGALYVGLAYNASEDGTKLRGIKLNASAEWSRIKPDEELMHKNFDEYGFINTYTDEATGESIVYATRMQSWLRVWNGNGELDDSSEGTIMQLISTTPCVYLDGYIYGYSLYGAHGDYQRLDIYQSVCRGTWTTFQQMDALLSNFNLAPKRMLYTVYKNGQGVDTSRATLVGDVEVGSDISRPSLCQLQQICLYSQWLVPAAVNKTGFTPRTLIK